ncbi:MAG: glycosyltransferase, partial [Calditrichota bacterium]
PIGIDRHDFPKRKLSRAIDVVGVGALTKLKNYSLFLDLIGELKEDLPDIRSVIIGSGPEQKQLESLILKYGLEANVRLTGHLDRSGVLQHMANSRILLHTSSYESQGYVFNEALYSGMSVVCFPVGNAASAKTHLCKTRREMLQALRNLLKSPCDTNPIMLQSIEETVAAFWGLYSRA